MVSISLPVIIHIYFSQQYGRLLNFLQFTKKLIKQYLWVETYSSRLNALCSIFSPLKVVLSLKDDLMNVEVCREIVILNNQFFLQ